MSDVPSGTMCSSQIHMKPWRKVTSDDTEGFTATTDNFFKWIMSNGGDVDIVEN